MQEKKDEKNLVSVSDRKSQMQKNLVTSESLSKNLSQKLINLIDDVNAEGVTPESVNASCNAASQIYKIMKLNFDMKKDGL